MKKDDIARVVRELRSLADLLAVNGARAVDVTAGWRQGPRSASTEPSGGWIYQNCDDLDPCDDCPHPKPSDPTGEAAAAGVDRAAGYHFELLNVLRTVEAAAVRADTIVRLACPQATKAVPTAEQTREEIAAAGWCVSCWRDNNACEPITTRPGGAPYYADMCRWCGDFKGAHVAVLGAQGYPPIKLVRLHRQGRRISDKQVTAALAEHARDVSRAAKKAS